MNPHSQSPALEPQRRAQRQTVSLRKTRRRRKDGRWARQDEHGRRTRVDERRAMTNDGRQRTTTKDGRRRGEGAAPFVLFPPDFQPTPLFLFVSCCLFFLCCRSPVDRTGGAERRGKACCPPIPFRRRSAQDARHVAWQPPRHITLGSQKQAATAIASGRCDDDDDKDAGSRIIDEPHMTLSCSSIQVPPTNKKKSLRSTNIFPLPAYLKMHVARPPPGRPYVEVSDIYGPTLPFPPPFPSGAPPVAGKLHQKGPAYMTCNRKWGLPLLRYSTLERLIFKTSPFFLKVH